MTFTTRITTLLAVLTLTGCASVTRDTWAGANTDLQQAHRACLDKANSGDLHGTAIGGGGLVGRAVRRSYYKDCMEEHGYRKLHSESISPRDGEACGAPDQTCTRDTVSPTGYQTAY